MIRKNFSIWFPIVLVVFGGVTTWATLKSEVDTLKTVVVKNEERSEKHKEKAVEQYEEIRKELTKIMVALKGIEIDLSHIKRNGGRR